MVVVDAKVAKVERRVAGTSNSRAKLDGTSNRATVNARGGSRNKKEKG